MKRSEKLAPRAVTGLVVGLGLAWTLPSPAQPPNDRPGGGNARSSAADEGRPEGNNSARGKSQERDSDEAASPDRVLESYQNFREKSGRAPDHTRREIERSVKELNELIEMRIQMALALAARRADLRMSGPGMPGMSVAGQGAGAAAHPGPTGDQKESGIQKREALSREYDQIFQQLRGEIESARNQADMLANQIRSLRDAQRQQGQQHQQGQPGHEQRERQNAQEQEARRLQQDSPRNSPPNNERALRESNEARRKNEAGASK